MIVCFDCNSNRVCYILDKEKFLCKKCYNKRAEQWAKQSEDPEFNTYY